MLKNDESEWISDSKELKNMKSQFYKDLFTADSSMGGDFITSFFSSLDASTREDLGKDVILEETRRV